MSFIGSNSRSSTQYYDEYSKILLHRYKNNPILSFPKFDSSYITCIDFLSQSTNSFIYGTNSGRLSVVTLENEKLISRCNIPLLQNVFVNTVATSIDLEVAVAADCSSIQHFQLTPQGIVSPLANWEGHLSHVTDIKYFSNPFGNIFLSSSMDGSIRCWSSKMKHSVFDFKVGIRCESVTFLSSEKPLEVVTSSLVQNENKLYVWDIRNQSTFLQVLQGSDQLDYHTPTPTTPSFLDPFSHIASDTESEDEDAFISYRKWSRPKKAPKPQLLNPSYELKGEAKTSRIFDSKTKTYKTKFEGHAPSKTIYHIQSTALRSRHQQVSIYPFQQLLSCSVDQRMNMWDCQTNQVVNSFDAQSRARPCFFKWNSTILCNISATELQFWNTKMDYSAPFFCKSVLASSPSANNLQCLSINEYDSMIAMGTDNGSIYVIDASH